MNYSPDLIATALRMLTALCVILGSLFMIFYFSKRVLKREGGGSKGRPIRVIASSYIGVKKNISLVQVPGAVLVLGVTGDNISLLSRIEDKEIIDEINRFQAEKTTPSFSDQLHRLSMKFKYSKNGSS